MREVINRIFLDYEKEEKWLNEMAVKGFALTDYFYIRYVFDKCEPGEYTYRIELLENHHGHPESKRYIAFMEESGAEHVASYMRWVYFRMKTADGRFDIYSDTESKMMHYKRIRNFYAALSVMELTFTVSNLTMGINRSIYGTSIMFSYFVAGFLLIAFVFCATMSTKMHKKIKALTARRVINE